MRFQQDHHGGRGDIVLLGAMVLSVLLILIVPLAGPVQGEVTRSDDVRYIGTFMGDGENNDVLLAGFRWYTCNFTFIDWISAVEKVRVTLTHGDTTEDLFEFNTSTQELSVLDMSGTIDVKDSILVQMGGNLTFSFKIWVHLNWTRATDDVEIRPVIESEGSIVPLDFLEKLKFDIEGRLEPVNEKIIVIDSMGRSVRPGESVRSGSSISVTGISFQYHDPAGRFSGFGPVSEEISPVVLVDGRVVNTSLRAGGYIADVEIPSSETGEMDISLDLPRIREKWLFNLETWLYTLKIDGMGPKIELIKPSADKIQANLSFQWNISLIDKPVRSGVNVNGSSVMYRIWTYSENWTDWTETDPVESGISIFVTGNGTGEPGMGNTLIQFRARDDLGNVNISREFEIWINSKPTINIPPDLDGRIFMNNMSLVIDGEMIAADPDGTQMFFKWYLDDSIPLSTLKDFRKPLFDVEPGSHTVRLVVSDGFVTVEDSFTIVVENVPEEEDERNFIEKFVDDDNFLWYMLPLVMIIVLIPLIIIIITVSRKVGESTRDDFVIDEEKTLDMKDAEETARHLLESMGRTDFGNEAEAEMEDDNGFDFEYNLYEVLGLQSSATDAEIKKRYRKMAAYYHPDRISQHKEVNEEDAREEMVKVNKAKEILLDGDQREQYDSYLEDSDFDVDIGESIEEDDEEFDDDWE